MEQRTATMVGGGRGQGGDAVDALDDSSSTADADPLTTAPGDIIANKYRVDSIIGRGGMGIVLGATHIALDERVAIKMLRPTFAGNPQAVARFLREARAAVKLKSPHVARVIDVDTLPSGAPYMVMEYLVGEDLERARGLEPLGITEAIAWVLQACEAVAEAHALRIVHRDLKPANLFRCTNVQGETEIKVLDFGVSRILDDSSVVRGIETSANAVIGTPAYMAPEQHESAQKTDERTDIWALGVILYELLTNKRPFLGDAPAVIYAMIITTATPSPRSARPELPAALADVVMRCLQRDPAARFQTVVDLATALEPFAAEPGAAERVRSVSISRSDSSRRVVAAPAAPPSSSNALAAVTATSLAHPSMSEDVAIEMPNDTSVDKSNRPRRPSVATFAIAAIGVALVVGAFAIAFRFFIKPHSSESTSPSASTSATAITIASTPTQAPAVALSARDPNDNIASSPPSAATTMTTPSSSPVAIAPSQRARRGAMPVATVAKTASPSSAPSPSPSPGSSSVEDSYKHRTF